MVRHSTVRRATGSLAIRAVIWLLALIATAGAVLSIDRVLRNRSGEEAAVAPAVILPASPGSGDRTAAGAVETAASKTAVNSAAALTGIVGDETRRDDGRRGDVRREEARREDGVPAFDIARVEPSGDTVIAGRASPGATVELLRNGSVHDRVVADASGQFAMVPPRLPAGDSELTLRSRPPGGAPAVSRQTVVVGVQPNFRDQPVVALMTPDKPSVVLSKPAAPDAPAAAGGSVVVETVEAEGGGRKLYVTGRSAPGALIRLYLNDGYHSTATADGGGRVAFTADSVAFTADGDGRGDYRVRLDEVDRASGIIKSRAEVPFTAPPVTTPAVVATAAAPGVPEGNAVASARAAAVEAGTGPGAPAAPPSPKGPGQVTVVSRGDSLWRISRSAYGDGARYTVIYDANHKQIRNPNRIYPGQVLVIPGGKGR
jgi:LysM repeat protein